jgi:hypothetical protein
MSKSRLAEQSIEQFVKDHGIQGKLCEVANTSAVFLWECRCLEVCLSRNGVTAKLHVYVGQAYPAMSVPDALGHLTEVAQRYGGEPDFETWNNQNDGGYCEQKLGRETAVGLYNYVRETHEGLVEVLGRDLHQELVALMNEATVAP